MGKSTINGIFNSYVSLPEGNFERSGTCWTRVAFPFEVVSKEARQQRAIEVAEREAAEKEKEHQSES